MKIISEIQEKINLFFIKMGKKEKKRKNRFKSSIFKKKIYATFKLEEAKGYLLCSKCKNNIKHSDDFSIEEMKAFIGLIKMEPVYCIKCNENNN